MPEDDHLFGNNIYFLCNNFTIHEGNPTTHFFEKSVLNNITITNNNKIMTFERCIFAKKKYPFPSQLGCLFCSSFLAWNLGTKNEHPFRKSKC